MQNFSYAARDNNGKAVRGTMMADNAVELSNKIASRGYYLVRSAVVNEEQLHASIKLFPINQKELLNFTIHLATLLDAGVPLVAAIRDLARGETKPNLRKLIDDIRYHVESGASFKEALSIQYRSFPKLYTAIVGAGEATGKLPDCLNELARLLYWRIELKAKIAEAATYPIILFCVMLGVVTLLMVKMIPTFESLFKEMNVPLPPATQMIIAISHFFRDSWPILAGAGLLLGIAYKLYNSTPQGKYILDSLKLKIPLAGDLLRKIALSRLCHTFALGLKSGVTILNALDFASEVVGNARIRRAVEKAKSSVNIGEKLGASFQASGEFPPLVVRMITVGEQSGALSQTLEKVNLFYDREIPAVIKTMFAFFEPLMIILMAVVVGGIAIAIFLPMFSLADAINK